MNKHRAALLFRNSVFLAIVALAPSLAHALDAPGDTRGTVIKPTEIKWEWAGSEGAVRYQVDVNGVFVAYVQGTAYRSVDLSDGDYWFTVQAVDNNNVHSHRSQKSATVTIGAGDSNDSRSHEDNQSSNASTENASADIPGNVQGTQVGANSARWTWNSVQGAESYIVYLNGDGQNPITTYEDNLVIDNLSVGDHSIKVAAVDSSTGRHSDQSSGATVTVNDDFANNNGNVSSDNNGAAPPPPENDNGLIDPASYNYNLKPGYNLVFSDEFNNNALNPNRWNTQLRWDGSWNGAWYEYRLINGESQFYVNTLSGHQEHLDKVASVHNPFEFDGQRLAIRATVNPNYDKNDPYNAYGPLDKIYKQQPFYSGAMSTYDKFSEQYGYFEARIKVPAVLGTFPAFWLHHQRRENEGTQKTEIDIMEHLGNNPKYAYGSFHYFTGVSEGVTGQGHHIKPSPEGQISSVNQFNISNFSDDYHVYAVEWKEGGVIDYFIDGQKVSEVRNWAADHEPLYIIMNMAVGGTWMNGPTNSGGSGRNDEGNPFPSEQDINEWSNPALEIDYVRVYKPQ